MGNFFVISVEHIVFYLLVEFESDQMSPQKSTKNERNRAHGLN